MRRCDVGVRRGWGHLSDVLHSAMLRGRVDLRVPLGVLHHRADVHLDTVQLRVGCDAWLKVRGVWGMYLVFGVNERNAIDDVGQEALPIDQCDLHVILDHDDACNLQTGL